MDLILYNPKSRNSKGNVEAHKLIKQYKKNNTQFRLKSILKIHDMREYLESKKHIKKVILLGGDGTINKLVNNIYDYDLQQEIYIKKNGSVNDFLRSLKKNDKNPQNIMSCTTDDKDTHYFINGTGIGLDGLIINYVDNSKRKGKFRYFVSSIRAMIKYQPEPLDIIIDGEKKHFEKAYLTVVNNGRFIGGGMQITPKADISNDDLDVVVVHKVPKFLILLIFSTIYLGLHTKFTRYVYAKKCKSIKATFKSPKFIQSDGELQENITSIDVKSSGKKIHLRAY